MADRGTWQSGVSYPTGDTVIWNDKKWEAIKNNVTSEPGTTGGTDWREVAIPTLTTLAKAALEAKRAAEAAQREAERKALIDQARTTLSSTLALPADVLATLDVVDVDMAIRRVVFTDESLALAVNLIAPINVRPVRRSDAGTWDPFLPPVTSLADLGAALS